MDFLFVSSLRNEPARFYLKLAFLFSEENLALPACGQKQAPAGGSNFFDHEPSGSESNIKTLCVFITKVHQKKKTALVAVFSFGAFGVNGKTRLYFCATKMKKGLTFALLCDTITALAIFWRY